MSFNEIAAVAVAEHELHLFYLFDGIDPKNGPKIELNNLPASVIPADQLDALSGRYANNTVWKKQENGEAPLSPDLYPFVRQLLSGAREELATCWQLDQHASKLLKSAALYEADVEPAQRTKKQLVLKPSASAAKRMHAVNVEATSFIIKMESAKLIAFGTGHSLADICVTIRRDDDQSLTAIELNEAVVSLNRFNEMKWVDVDSAEVVSDAFSFGELVRALSLGAEAQSKPSNRVATYLFARFAEPVEQTVIGKYAAMSALHYTTDYKVADEELDGRLLRPFVNVTHSVAQEGAATIIAPTLEEANLPEFLETFKANVFLRAYVPAAILALHEEAFLLSRTMSSTGTFADIENSTVEDLKHLHEAALIFRLCYRFTKISQISMHINLHHAFRSAFHSEELLQELTYDVEATEAYLRKTARSLESAEEHERHRQYYWASIVGGSALAGLTTYTIVKEVAYLILSNKTQAGWTGVGLGLLIAFIAAIVGFLKRPKKHNHDHAGHLTRHAMIEHMIKGALK